MGAAPLAGPARATGQGEPVFLAYNFEEREFLANSVWQLHEDDSCQEVDGAPQYMSALQPALLAESTRLLGIIPNNTGGFGNAEEALQVFMVDEISPIQTRIRA